MKINSTITLILSTLKCCTTRHVASIYEYIYLLVRLRVPNILLKGSFSLDMDIPIRVNIEG